MCQHRPEAAEQPGAWLVNFDRVRRLAGPCPGYGAGGSHASVGSHFSFHRRLSENVGVRPLVDVLLLDLAACGRRVVA